MIYKIVKYPFFRKYMVKWINPIPENKRKEWKKVTVKSKTGGIIKGLFAKSKSETEKATLALGPYKSKEAKGHFIKRGHTKFLRNTGFNALISDINGFGCTLLSIRVLFTKLVD